MLHTFTPDETSLKPSSTSDALERGRIVHFPQCPVPLPDEEDLEFLREELPRRLNLKNISYHPELNKVLGIKGDHHIVERAERILVEHSRHVERFLTGTIRSLARNWTVGTSSFRPVQEKGRGLKPHASNELVHVDAGAYGATNGDRILRFFVNVNPDEDRVWGTRGTFAELYHRYGVAAGVTPDLRAGNGLRKSPFGNLRTATCNRLCSAGVPLANMLDSSPYDRVMRQFHNFMKDNSEFRDNGDDLTVIHFKPFSAWMVLTDMVSHASLSGQHALVNTFLIRLENCHFQELAPINILRSS